MPIKVVEAFDLKLSTEWRRCASMNLDRSDFCVVSNLSSDFIYVFGGTLNENDKRIIERYNNKEDLWEILPF